MKTALVRKKTTMISAARADIASVLAEKLDIEPQVIITALDSPEGDKLHVWWIDGEHEIDTVEEDDKE